MRPPSAGSPSACAIAGRKSHALKLTHDRNLEFEILTAKSPIGDLVSLSFCEPRHVDICTLGGASFFLL